jgi:hypothetical protein
VTASEITMRRVVVAAVLVVAASVVMGVLAWRQSFPPIVEWAVFAAAFVVLEWRSVQIDGAFGLSPSIMVTFTAAVVFDPASAVLGVAAFEVIGALSRRDIEERRWFEPLVNMSQMALSAAVGIGVLAIMCPQPLTRENLWQVVGAAAVAAVVYGSVNFGIVAAVLRTTSGVDITGSHIITTIHLPYLAMGLLGGLLGSTYALVGAAALPFVAVVFVAGDLATRSYAQLRASQEEVMAGFARAMEAKDMFSRNLTARMVELTEATAHRLGLGRRDVELLRWASVVTGISRLAVPQELLRKREALTAQEYALLQERIAAVERLLGEVECLRPGVDLAAQRREASSGRPALADVLRVAEAYNAMTSLRAYRSVMGDAAAVAELRAHAGSQFASEVVEALVAVVAGDAEPAPVVTVGDERD